MKAIVLKDANTTPTFSDFPIKKEVDKVKVELHASAINHRDLWIIKGQYAGIKYPIILGSDGVGLLDGKKVIINPGQNWGNNQNVQSKDFKILGLPDNGTFAEYVYVDKKYIYPAPKHLTDFEAAALPLGGLTAFRALFTRAKIKKGEKILISGIGGGVALFAMQFAVAAGLEVYVSSSSDDKIEKAIALGAKNGINYTVENWYKNLIAMSGGIDVIVDSAAGPDFNNYLKVINPGGRLVVYGGTRGNIQNLSPQILFWKQVSILGSTMGSDKDFTDMLDFVNKYKIKPVLDSLYDLQDFNIALNRMKTGIQFGKIVLRNMTRMPI